MGEFSESFTALLGPKAPRLPASAVVRLREAWQEKYAAWAKRSLAGKSYVYFWLVRGAAPEGKKELVAIANGLRESEQSCTELLLDLKVRGLEIGPHVAFGTHTLGPWKALRKVYGESREQRCWVQRTSNVLCKLPKGKQGNAKGMLHDIWMAATGEEAVQATPLFTDYYQAKFPGGVDRLVKDRGVLLTFYAFPTEHCVHLRTTTPIESMFATTTKFRTKGCGPRIRRQPWCTSWLSRLSSTGQHSMVLTFSTM